MRRNLKRFDDRPFPAFSSDFDKKFNSGFKLAIVGVIGAICVWLVYWAVYLSAIGFVGWAIYKLLQHNGVI